MEFTNLIKILYINEYQTELSSTYQVNSKVKVYYKIPFYGNELKLINIKAIVVPFLMKKKNVVLRYLKSQWIS